MADKASRLTHLLDWQFISHFLTHLPQSKPWRLPPLQSGYKQQLTTMMHNNQSPRGSLQLSSRKTQPPGDNGGASASGCKLPLTARTTRTTSLPPKFCRYSGGQPLPPAGNIEAGCPVPAVAHARFRIHARPYCLPCWGLQAKFFVIR